MEQEITFGARLLHGVLSFTVVALTGVLACVAICMILWSVGVL